MRKIGKEHENNDSTYGKALDLYNVAMDMASSVHGLTLDEIQERLKDGACRRTAERARNALERLFDVEEVECNERKKRWRIKVDHNNPSFSNLVKITAEELKSLETAIEILGKQGLMNQADSLRKVSVVIKTLTAKKNANDDAEFFLSNEGLACRPGPKVSYDQKTLLMINTALQNWHRIKFTYHRNNAAPYEPIVEPYGIIYGDRNHYLVAIDTYDKKMKHYSIDKMTDIVDTLDLFEKDENFNMKKYCKQMFGSFHQDPIYVELLFDQRAKERAKKFIFHNTEQKRENPDGTLTVSFTASGILEMAWHIITWGSTVKVIQPEDFWQRADEAQKYYDDNM
ncbi:MAG: WYL domain-containing protein [Alphaproteobacteria bacterium]|nr:WYL domain-containing protein [Alphaproteobacteria bacterium]